MSANLFLKKAIERETAKQTEPLKEEIQELNRQLLETQEENKKLSDMFAKLFVAKSGDVCKYLLDCSMRNGFCVEAADEFRDKCTTLKQFEANRDEVKKILNG